MESREKGPGLQMPANVGICLWESITHVPTVYMHVLSPQNSQTPQTTEIVPEWYREISRCMREIPLLTGRIVPSAKR